VEGRFVMSNITVIVPCYNGELFIARCIDSLLKQTMAVNIILVNDGSTDNTEKVAQEYSDKFENIILINKNNQGLPLAKQTGIDYVKNSKYVAFVDCDDWVESEMYERMYLAIEREQADIAWCGIYKTYESGDSIPLRRKLAKNTVFSSDEAMHALHSRMDYYPYLNNKLFRKELFDNIKYKKGNFIGEDYCFQVQLLLRAKKILSVEGTFYHYWQSVSSMSRGGVRDIHVLSYQYYNELLSEIMVEKPILYKDACCYLVVEYMAFVIAMSRNNNYNNNMLLEIVDFIRTHIWKFLGNRDIEVKYKVSALIICIHYKWLIKLYKFITMSN